MTAPTAAQLALLRSNLPVKRVVSSSSSAPTHFAEMLKAARASKQPIAVKLPNASAPVFHSPMIQAAAPAQLVSGGPAPLSRSEILKNADPLMGVPYVWGGTVASGLDCSAFVSRSEEHTSELQSHSFI